MDIDRDLEPFGAMLDAVCGLLSRGAYTPNEVSTAIFFRALQPWPFERVRAAFDAHVRDPERGRFVPTPADILAYVNLLSPEAPRQGMFRVNARAPGVRVAAVLPESVRVERSR